MNDRRMDEQPGTFERMGEQLGGAAGRMFERGSEMAGGVLGSMVDSMVNTLGDWWSSSEARNAARSFSEKRDATCRRHFETSASGSTGTGYDQVRPLYQFGHMASQNPEFSGRDFDQVEPDLRRAWSSDASRQNADWSDVRGYVDFGFSGNSEPLRD